MNRRTTLLATGSLAALALTGCLGDGSESPDPSADDGTTDDADSGPLVESTEIDPDAPYVVNGPEGPFSARGPLNADLNGVAIHGYDLVGYFEAGQPMAGSASNAYEYRGATFHFASAEHRETFAADPAAYLPEFGGYCSLGVGNGYKDGMHPAAFELIDDKLYFNLTPRIHEGWLRNYEARIASGEENWPEIKHSTDSIHIGPGLP